VTTAGEHEFTLHHVKETLLPPTAADLFPSARGILSTLTASASIKEDISLQAAELATSLSYRDAVAHGDGFTPIPSITTVNRRVREYGSKLGDFVRDRLPGTNADTVVPDGTKCHSQQDHCTYHDVNVTLGQTAEGDDTKPHSLDVNVSESWDGNSRSPRRFTGAVTDDATVVSDAPKRRRRCVRVVTDLTNSISFTLVERSGTSSGRDDAFPLSERKAIVSGVTDDLFHLKNSVALHADRMSVWRSASGSTKRSKIIGKEAWRLERQDSPKATAYLREWAEATVTFAELALDQQQVPWTSNVVERAMGEVSKRCKNQWMQWSEAGLESLLWLNLVQYADPEQFAAFADELLERSTKTAITIALLNARRRQY